MVLKVLAVQALLALGVFDKLEWEAPRSCPSAAQFEALVHGYLGAGASQEAPENLVELRVHIAPVGPNWRMNVLLLSEDTGERRLELLLADCYELGRDAAVFVATSLDPFAVDRQLAQALTTPHALELPATSSEVTPPIVVAAQAPTDEPEQVLAELRSEPEPRRTEGAAPPQAGDPVPAGLVDRGGEPPKSWFVVAASGGLSLGLFDGPNPGVHAELGIERGLLRAMIYGGTELAGRFRDELDPSRGGDLRTWMLGARGCVSPRWKRGQVRGCLGLGSGELIGRGVGLEDASTQRRPWIWLSPALGGALTLTQNLALIAELGPSFTLLRAHFAIEEPRQDYIMPIVSGRALLGLELRLSR